VAAGLREQLRRTLDGSRVSCTAVSAVTIGSGGGFEVVWSVSASEPGPYANAAGGGICQVDPRNVVVKANETNNLCGDTVLVQAPEQTPGPTNLMDDSGGPDESEE
jgi:hypothetical protein